MKAKQFSLSRLLFSIAVIAALLGGTLSLLRSFKNAQTEAIRQAIRAGRMDGEEYRRFFTAEEFDQLRKEAGKQPDPQ